MIFRSYFFSKIKYKQSFNQEKRQEKGWKQIRKRLETDKKKVGDKKKIRKRKNFRFFKLKQDFDY